MRKIFVLGMVFYSGVTLANESARKYIIDDLSRYGADYGVQNFSVLDYLGVQNKMYTFNIIYKKRFCSDIDNSCSILQCNGIVGLDSDAVIDFEPEIDSSKCRDQQ